MKKCLLLLSLLPLMTPAADVRGLPEDFRQYFYDAELIVQVYLNDLRLFDAAVSLKESGEVRLLNTFDIAQETPQDTQAVWTDVLKQGVTIGECAKNCPAGLMAVEYRLDSSILKLYTSHYESARTSSDWINIQESVPNGLIMSNDASITNATSSRSWGLNSSLTSSFSDWSQTASFQTSGVDGNYSYSSASLYELFAQKELQGSFARFGFFAPDSDTGNVQTSGLGYDTIVGAMWGTSDTLLTRKESVSAWPVYVTGRERSVAEVWRDGRLIHTQQLQAGVQALNTRSLPGGIYDITIKIIENGQLVDTQKSQIFKPQGWVNPDRRWRTNLWGGQRRIVATGEGRTQDETPWAIGGGVDLLAHPRAILGVSGAATDKEHHVKTWSNITLSAHDTLYANYTLANTEFKSDKNTDIRYYRNFSAGGSASLFWRSTTTDFYGYKTQSRQQGDTWGSSLSLRLPGSTSLIVNGQHIDSAWRKGLGMDVAINTSALVTGRDASLTLSAYNRPGFNQNPRDHGVSVGVTLSLAAATRHSVSAATGMEQNQSYSSLDYRWQPAEESSIRTLGGGVLVSATNTIISGNAAVDTQYVSGDTFIQHDVRNRTNTSGGNLNQVLVLGDGRVASVNGSHSRSMTSALIVDVDSDDAETQVIASGNTSETRLKPGRNIVPTELWKKGTIQFSASDGSSVQVSPQRATVQMRPGSVKYIRVKAVKTFTLVGMLRDEAGNLLKNRYVSTDVSDGMINAEGVLTLDSGMTNLMLNIRAENKQPAMRCELPAIPDRSRRVQFFNSVPCKILSEREKQ